MIDFKNVKAGDIIYYTGTMYTARDAAHLRIRDIIKNNETLPVDFTDSLIYYAGPTPTKPGNSVGSIGPTTSSRMDDFIDMMPTLKIKGMVGKGPRDKQVVNACKEYNLVYLLATGGTGALLSKCVKSSEEIAFFDLGCESIKKLEVENFPLIVAYDIFGNDIFERSENNEFKR